MDISAEGIDFIKQHEGCRLEAYQDSIGIWTIGYGHVRGVYPTQCITQEQADGLLVIDLQPAVRCVNASVTGVISQTQFDALCSFVFNLGCNSLKNSTLLRKINDGDDAGAASEFGKWNHAGGKVIAGLTQRREDEMELFLS